MMNVQPPPPPAEELKLLDRELFRLEHRRKQLLARRAWLISVLQSPAAPAPPLARAGAGTASSGAARAGEVSPPGAQNALLILGGLLLTVAAVAFTLVGWGRLGVGGRSAVLAVVTAGALAAPVALLRRRLGATAEAVAVLGLVLLALDAYALHRAFLPDVAGPVYVAWASAALAALWAAYGRGVRRLAAPLPAAVVAAQFPLVLWSVSGASVAPSLQWALLATAAFDVAVVVRARREGVVVTAAAGTVATGGAALLLGVAGAFLARTPAGALEPAALLTAAAAPALVAARHLAPAAFALAATAGLSLVAGVGGVVRAAAPDGWGVLGPLLCAVALAALTGTGRLRALCPPRLLAGLAAASAAVQALALLSVLPFLALALAGPLTVLPDVWSGGSTPGAVDALGGGALLGAPAAAPVVLLILAGSLAAFSRGRGGAGITPAAASAPAGSPAGDGAVWRAAAGGGALALLWAALFALPVALGAGYAAVLAVQVLITLAALAAAVRPGPGAGLPGAAAVAAGCGLTGGASAAVLALASRPATFAVLGVLLAACAATALVPRAAHAVRAAVACAAVAAGAGLIASLGAAAGLGSHEVAPALMAAPALVALIAARPGARPLAPPLECAGAAVGVLAVLSALGRLPSLALVLALGGAIAAGTAVRPERRSTAAPVAAVLFVLAAWARLAASGVAVPEAYALPASIPVLAAGVLRRRREPGTSSWRAYGPGLATTLVTSLLALWTDAQGPRALLLGLAALALTLIGARRRLQAPLVLGGTVLALVTLRELAPYVLLALSALPRWLPPALAGLLLLAVGASYEQRLRDARRARAALSRMH